MFSVAPNGQCVPSKNVKLKPVNLSAVQPGDEIKFDIPSYLQLINPQATYLTYDLTMTGSAYQGRVAPDKRAAGHSLFRTVNIRSGDDSTQLVYEDDYNMHQALLRECSKNPSIEHTRELFDGAQPDPDIKGSGDTIFYRQQSDTSEFPLTKASTIDTTDASKKAVKTPRIRHRLNCGLMGQDKVIPVIATSGLRLTLQTETDTRALVYDDYDSSGHHIGSGPNTNSVFFAGITTEGTSITSPTTRTFGTEQTIFVQSSASASGSDFSVGSNNPGFQIDDVLCIGTSTGVSEETLGTVTQIEQAAGKHQCKVVPHTDQDYSHTHAAADDGSRVYYKQSDRQAGGARARVNDSAAPTFSLAPPPYLIENVELHAQAVSPPESYTSAMLSQIGKGGVEMECNSYTLHRFNLTTATGLLTQEIPATETLARSALSAPVFLSDFQDVSKPSFLPAGVDQVERRMCQHGLKQIPRRRVELGRYSQSVGGTTRVEPIHLEQAQKALVNCGYAARNLHDIAKKFFIGRAFTRYGQIYNLRDETLSLQTTYGSGASQQKMFNHFVHGVRIMKIGAMGVEVIK